MIELYSSPTPNGQKIMIMLEETGLEWRHVDVDIGLGDQFSPEHLARSPNNKIPAIVDTGGPAGAPYVMMESGAILCYLAEKAGMLLPAAPREHYDTLQWLFFQVAHVGPMFGQANHFNGQAQAHAYARQRYNDECLRLYRVLDNRLMASPWLAGAAYTIADIATYPWCRRHAERGIDAASHPGFTRWFQAMEARPAVQRSNALAAEIRARMARAAEGRPAIDIYDTRDNAERLARATAPRRQES
ncbi:glutathione S-transferase N-terminal domain-containing protein [Nitrosovibrio sp. Nv17]|uniref:glutathione S-transferase N-terminal domain-containing protein n=1 Tax=Nitrosovibrio sp. Nv17 TaxID=1855339 RepID=UPI000908AB7F|nr:glutathione S-transferase N-terminal domain-containing protein [Nitrosovibrio sp. Nv17]SFW30551.1 GST-like protein [Nitrosovibrio sp. Nv17]